MKENYKYRDVNFTPASNRIIVKCNKFATYTQMQTVVVNKENQTPEELKNNVQETKLEPRKIKYYYQVAEIVALPADDKSGYNIGDKVLVDFRAAKKFDLYKDLYWLWLMDIVGKVKEE